MHSISSGSSFRKPPAHRENFRRIKTCQTQIPQRLRVFRGVSVLLRFSEKRLDALRPLWQTAQTPTNGGILGSFVNWPGNKKQHFLGLLVWCYSEMSDSLLDGLPREAWTWRMPRWWSRSTGLIIHGSQILSKKLQWNHVKSHSDCCTEQIQHVCFRLRWGYCGGGSVLI